MSNIIQYIVPYNKPILGAKDKHFIPHTHQNYYLQVVAFAVPVTIAVVDAFAIVFAKLSPAQCNSNFSWLG